MKKHYRYPDKELEPKEMITQNYIIAKSYWSSEVYKGNPDFRMIGESTGAVYLDGKMVAAYSNIGDAGEIVEKFDRHFMVYVE